MKCPACPESTLLMSDRQGVEIDYCPQCRGIWLDRGELDKLLERSAAQQPQRPVSAQPPAQMRRPDFVDSDHHGHHSAKSGHYRKKSWLNDIFD